MNTRSALPAALLLCLSITPALSPALMAGTWKGDGGDSLWSNTANWSPAATPFGTAVLFETDGMTTRDQVGNIVATSGTINALHYKGYNATGWQVTQINSGVTLTVNGAGTNGVFTVGQSSRDASAQTTKAAIQGDGALVINKSTGTIYISNSGNDGIGYGELDMSGLKSFSATVDQISVGGDGSSQGVLRLAKTNTITAGTLRIGRSLARTNVPESKASLIELGGSNTFNVGSFQVAGEDVGSISPMKASGIVRFAATDGTSTMTLRGQTGGTSRAAMMVGHSVAGSASLEGSTGIADFRGGSIDFRLDTLKVGYGNNSSSTGWMRGEFHMDAGAVDALSVTLGLSTTGGAKIAGAATGLLNIEGGSFVTQSLALARNEAGGQSVEGRVALSGGSLTVEEGIVMGSVNPLLDSTTRATSVKAILDIAGGTLSVGGDIAQGDATPSIRSEINLNGGTLDFNGHKASVTGMTLTSGTLRNLGEYNDGAALSKTGAGRLEMAGLHSFTGETQVDVGELVVSGTLANTAGVRVAGGAVLSGSGVIGSAVTVEEGGSIALQETLRIDGLSMEADASLAFTLGGSARLVSTGAATLAGDLRLTLDGVLLDGEVITLLANESGAALGGAFDTVNGVQIEAGQPFTITLDGGLYLAELSYQGAGSLLTGGNDLVLKVQAIPEPSAVAFLVTAGGAIVLASRARRRQGGTVA